MAIDFGSIDFWVFFGTVKNSLDLLVGPKISMLICLNLMAWIVWKMIC